MVIDVHVEIKIDNMISIFDYIFNNSDWDIDKSYHIPNQSFKDKEDLCYRRIKAIHKSLAENNPVKWNLIVENINNDLEFLKQLIDENLLSNKKEFIKCIKIYKSVYIQYNTYIQNNLNSIESILLTKEKDIDDMNKEELLEYIKKHNIK